MLGYVVYRDQLSLSLSLSLSMMMMMTVHVAEWHCRKCHEKAAKSIQRIPCFYHHQWRVAILIDSLHVGTVVYEYSGEIDTEMACSSM